MMPVTPCNPVANPGRGNAMAPRRPAPCSGLFGWRKDAKPPVPPAPQDRDKPPR